LTNYLTLTWATEPPVSAGEGEANVLFLVSGSVPVGQDNPFILTSTTYADILTQSTLPYVAASSYFKQFTGTPSNTTYMYMMSVSGNAQTGTLIYSGIPLYYEVPYKPVLSVSKVFINLNDGQGSGWQEINAGVNALTGSTGYFLDTGSAGNYNGIIFFGTGNGATGGGPYFSSGGTTYTGFIPASSSFRSFYQEDSFSEAARQISALDVQIIVPVHNVLDSGGIVYMISGAEQDFAKTLDMIAGQRKIATFAVPKYESLTGMKNGNDWDELIDYIGNNKQAAVIYADVETDGSMPEDDPASMYAGQIAITHPHTTLSFAVPVISLASLANKQEQMRWEQGQIACIFRESDLHFLANQISYGFTFAGTSPSNRINNVRCKHIVAFNILADLWRLLSSRTVRMTPSGMRIVRGTIDSTLNRMLAKGIIDPGKRIILISDPDATARLTRRIASVKIRWTWDTSLEGIDITEFGEII